MINFTSPSRMVPALAAGQLDVGSGSIGPGLFNGGDNSTCIKIVGPLARQEVDASNVFLFLRHELASNGSVRGYADLKGLHIGILTRDSTSEYTLVKMLGAGGLGLGDVHAVQMSYPTMLVALANRSLDAALLPESVATAAADKNLGIKWKPVADVAPGAQFGVVLFSPHFANQRDTAVRWMSAYLQGARDYDAAFFHHVHRTKVVDALTKSSPMKDARMYDEMGYAVIDPNGVLNLDSVADQVHWFVDAGKLHDAVDVSHVVDGSYVQAAVERLGPYEPSRV
jgi:NitT/TauT family transport system substrate-binding protein